MCVFSYKFILLYIVIVLIVRIVGGFDIDSDPLERENENFEASERRFMETFNDEDWHIAHLKETDFEEDDPVRTRRLDSSCLPETFAQKIKRYRRTLKNDPAFIEFVSAQAIPVDESELLQPQCNMANETIIKDMTQTSEMDTSVPIEPTTESEMPAIFPIMEHTGGNVQLEDFEAPIDQSTEPSVNMKHPDDVVFRASTSEVESKTETTNDKKVNTSEKGSVNQTLLNTTVVPPLTSIDTVSQSVNTQTEPNSNDAAAKMDTPTSSANKDDKKSTKTLNNGPEVVHQATTPKVKHKKKQPESRRGEYMFSSHEYYDEVIDFNANTCPDDVEVTELELDMLRPYDAECSLALEWTSLE